MDVYSILTNVSAGGFVAMGVIILTLIEVTPVKISPLQWIGKRINGEILKRVESVDSKLDQHVAQSYRNKILSFQDDIIEGRPKTKEQWKEVINAISCYEEYCEKNKVVNGLCTNASSFLNTEYQQHLANKDLK